MEIIGIIISLRLPHCQFDSCSILRVFNNGFLCNTELGYMFLWRFSFQHSSKVNRCDNNRSPLNNTCPPGEILVLNLNDGEVFLSKHFDRIKSSWKWHESTIHRCLRWKFFYEFMIDVVLSYRGLNRAKLVARHPIDSKLLFFLSIWFSSSTQNSFGNRWYPENSDIFGTRTRDPKMLEISGHSQTVHIFGLGPDWDLSWSLMPNVLLKRNLK